MHFLAEIINVYFLAHKLIGKQSKKTDRKHLRMYIFLPFEVKNKVTKSVLSMLQRITGKMGELIGDS